MQKWFASDYHLGHENIIKYCQRPFKNLNHMNNEIIQRHNQRVKPNDMVFFLGDFCFRNSPGGKSGEGESHKAEYYLKQLNGMFIPLQGNHDRNNSLKTNIEKIIIRYANQRINLCHNPVNADPRYKFNFCGHKHNLWKFKRFGHKSYIINISCDMWNFYPVRFEEIMREFKKWVRTKRYPNEVYRRGRDWRKGV